MESLAVILVLCVIAYACSATLLVVLYFQAKARADELIAEANAAVTEAQKTAATIVDSHNNVVKLQAQHDQDITNIKQLLEFVRARK